MLEFLLFDKASVFVSLCVAQAVLKRDKQLVELQYLLLEWQT